MAETLNQKVIHRASGQIGKPVGRGECWDLAHWALTKSGAGSSHDFGPDGDDVDYVWGDEVPHLKDVIPGDILQYRNYVETTTTTTEMKFADGSTWKEERVASMSHEHHTSIVSTNPGNGALTVLEQNYLGHHERVKLTHMRWKDAPETASTKKDKVKRRDTGKIEVATIKIVVDVTVTGTIKAYRPKVKPGP